ncbi:MAG: hypothetical protein KGD59_03835 [Candidatus Heimdallarchaeota archaeon]|nr:hypothetical protein [Candidatus Heimdallarchaeota archaeon]MBY8993655.1 hypothetical protein [Candidatus Heimdallarchaeota archaeon]
MIKRVLIIKNDLPLVYRNYEPGAEPSPGTSFGDYQSIVESITSKAIARQQREEISGNNKFVYELDGSILFLVSTDINEVGVIEILLTELKNLFFAVFPKDYILGWTGDDTSVFKGFESKLDQLRSAFENRIMTKPGSRRILETLSVMELPQRLQKTALSILDAKISSFEEIISNTRVTPQEAVANIQEILNAGFLYTTKIGNKVFYSVKSFSVAAPLPVTPIAAPIITPTAPTEPVTAKSTDEIPIGVEVKKRDTNKGNMPFLMKQFKKDLDKVFNTVLNRKLLLVVLDPETDKNQVLLNMILDTFQCFVPDRELRVVNFATDFIHPRDADIIRVDRSLLQFYSNETSIDMDNKKIINGDNSIYLADIVKEMTKLKHSECLSLLINRVALIEKLAQDWAKIKKLNLPSEDFITNVRTKYNPAIIQVMDNVAINIFMD